MVMLRRLRKRTHNLTVTLFELEFTLTAPCTWYLYDWPRWDVEM